MVTAGQTNQIHWLIHPYCPTSVVLLAFSSGIQITIANYQLFIQPHLRALTFAKAYLQRGVRTVLHFNSKSKNGRSSSTAWSPSS